MASGRKQEAREDELARIRELQARVDRLRARRAELREQDKPADLAAVEAELSDANMRLVQLTDLRGFDRLE